MPRASFVRSVLICVFHARISSYSFSFSTTVPQLSRALAFLSLEPDTECESIVVLSSNVLRKEAGAEKTFRNRDVGIDFHCFRIGYDSALDSASSVGSLSLNYNSPIGGVRRIPHGRRLKGFSRSLHSLERLFCDE